jgi:dihydrofolate reductase
MRRIVVSQFVSLDGVIEDPVGIESLGRGAWSSSTDSGPEGAKLKIDEMMESEAMLLGRKTYDGYLAAWPERGGDYADKINGMPKYVVSSTLRDPEWNNTTVLSGDAADEVSRLKDQRGSQPPLLRGPGPRGRARAGRLPGGRRRGRDHGLPPYPQLSVRRRRRRGGVIITG